MASTADRTQLSRPISRGTVRDQKRDGIGPARARERALWKRSRYAASAGSVQQDEEDDGDGLDGSGGGGSGEIAADGDAADETTYAVLLPPSLVLLLLYGDGDGDGDGLVEDCGGGGGRGRRVRMGTSRRLCRFLLPTLPSSGVPVPSW